MDNKRRDNSRTIRARRGSEIVARHWTTEAAVRMLMNNLDPEVAESPHELVVYGGIGRAARNWDCFDRIVEVLERLDKAGATRYVVTDITKDGTMRGPNLDLLREVCARTDRPVIASGGVSTLDDLRALAGLESIGVEGVIAGKALYAGAFTVLVMGAILIPIWIRAARTPRDPDSQTPTGTPVAGH